MGFFINEEIAADARLVKSASRPVFKDILNEFEQKDKLPKSKLDKNENSKKFLVIFILTGQSKTTNLLWF